MDSVAGPRAKKKARPSDAKRSRFLAPPPPSPPPPPSASRPLSSLPLQASGGTSLLVASSSLAPPPPPPALPLPFGVALKRRPVRKKPRRHPAAFLPPPLPPSVSRFPAPPPPPSPRPPTSASVPLTAPLSAPDSRVASFEAFLAQRLGPLTASPKPPPSTSAAKPRRPSSSSASLVGGGGGGGGGGDTEKRVGSAGTNRRTKKVDANVSVHALDREGDNGSGEKKVAAEQGDDAQGSEQDSEPATAEDALRAAERAALNARFLAAFGMAASQKSRQKASRGRHSRADENADADADADDEQKGGRRTTFPKRQGGAASVIRVDTRTGKKAAAAASTPALWSERHRPRRLCDLTWNRDCTERLQRIADAPAEMPHLLLYGPSGAGKATRAGALFEALFGPVPLVYETRSYVARSKSKTLYTCRVEANGRVAQMSLVFLRHRPAAAMEVLMDALDRFVRSSSARSAVSMFAEHREATATAAVAAAVGGSDGAKPAADEGSDLSDDGDGDGDDDALRCIAREAKAATAQIETTHNKGRETGDAQGPRPDEKREASSTARPGTSAGETTPLFRIFHLYNFDQLPREVQEATRRLMETHADVCRWVLTAENIARVIRPLHSRCCVIRVARPTADEAIASLEPLLMQHVHENLAVGAGVLGDDRLASAFVLASDRDVRLETRRLVRRNRRDFAACLFEAQVAARRERTDVDIIFRTLTATDPAAADPAATNSSAGAVAPVGDGDGDGDGDGAEIKGESTTATAAAAAPLLKPEAENDDDNDDRPAYDRMWAWQRAVYELVTHIVRAKSDSNIAIDSYRSMAARLCDEYALAPAHILKLLLTQLGRRETLTPLEQMAAIRVIAQHDHLMTQSSEPHRVLESAIFGIIRAVRLAEHDVDQKFLV